jgi:hypothetical protein
MDNSLQQRFSSADDLDKMLILVEQVCTKSAIQDLLRRAQSDDASVRVSGNKGEVINTHLKSAINSGAIEKSLVYNALCSAEENGNQHIFYYVPKTKGFHVKYSDATAIPLNLLGANWQSQYRFPRFELMPAGIVWSDFRTVKTPDGQFNWILKLYAGNERRTFLEERAEGDNFIRIYTKTLSREVYLVKWHHFGLLEMRVPRQSSQKAIMESLFGLWTMVEKAISSEDFETFDLTKASRELIDRHSSQNARYRLGDVYFMDDDTGSARFAPPSSEDDVMDHESREKAIKYFETCRELTVIWLPSSATDAIEDELRTVIGKVRPNGILIASQATATAVDYVTYRLWELAS